VEDVDALHAHFLERELLADHALDIVAPQTRLTSGRSRSVILGFVLAGDTCTSLALWYSSDGRDGDAGIVVADDAKDVRIGANLLGVGDAISGLAWSSNGTTWTVSPGP